MLGRIDLGEYKGPKPKIYGVKRSLAQSSPAWERTDDAIDLYAEATHNGSTVRNDFDDLYPWSDIYTYSWNASSGKETRYDESDFSYTDDYVMTKIPEFWWKRWQDGTNEYIQIATGETEGFTKVNEFSIGRYPISGSSSKIYSKSGTAPMGNATRAQFRSYAKAVGSNFGLMDWRFFILQILYIVEYANYNSQIMLGYGVYNASAMVKNGECDALGMKSGCFINDGTHSVVYRGIENIFGNIFQWVDGLNVSNYRTYVCYDPSKYTDDVFSGDYKAVSYTNASSDNYSSILGYDSSQPLISIPIAAGGSETTYTCDFYYRQSGDMVSAIGGYYSNGLRNGFWYWAILNSSTYASTTRGSRLLRY